MRLCVRGRDRARLLPHLQGSRCVSETGPLKRLFEDRLAGALRLHRVSAPLFVSASSGLNDDLNGVERPVSFEINRVEDTAQVVHSLAKWKRLALKRYQFHPCLLYTSRCV